MDSLGYFGKWFPTEHKKYTAIIAMMYVGVVTTVLGVLFEIALRGLAMIGLFGGPAGVRRTMVNVSGSVTNSIMIDKQLGTLDMTKYNSH